MLARKKTSGLGPGSRGTSKSIPIILPRESPTEQQLDIFCFQYPTPKAHPSTVPFHLHPHQSHKTILVTMLSSSIPFLLCALGVLVSLPSAAALTGSGTIAVLVGDNSTTSYTTTTPADVVGCLNAQGKLTANDCATFTVDGYRILTEAGACSFYNSSQPANTADVYGNNVYAFYCWEHDTMSTDTQFYTIVSHLKKAPFPPVRVLPWESTWGRGGGERGGG